MSSSIWIKVEALLLLAVLQIAVIAVHIEDLEVIADREILDARARELLKRFERLADRLEIGP